MHEKQHKTLVLLLSVALAVFLALSAYLFVLYQQKNSALSSLSETSSEQQKIYAQQLAQASSTIAVLTEELDLTSEELEDLEDDYRKEKDKNDEFEDQIRAITGTVKDLDKLSKTDEELLQKYSKVYFLNENYVPSDIDKIENKYVLEGKTPQYFHGDALSFLEDMLDEAYDDDVDLKVTSAYRSFDEQTQLKGQYTQTYGTGANTFSADQGYSEHQLGTTVDLTIPAIGGTYESFAQTDAYQWLLRNAHRFGFTLSYPEDNGFYVFEPWHWRFVGEELARDLHDDKAHFYDWDQREIDTYLIKIFD